MPARTKMTEDGFIHTRYWWDWSHTVSCETHSGFISCHWLLTCFTSSEPSVGQGAERPVHTSLKKETLQTCKHGMPCMYSMWLRSTEDVHVVCLCMQSGASETVLQWGCNERNNMTLFSEEASQAYSTKYCCMPPANSLSRQISDVRSDMTQRALYVSRRATWRWNKMLLVRTFCFIILAS